MIHMLYDTILHYNMASYTILHYTIVEYNAIDQHTRGRGREPDGRRRAAADHRHRGAVPRGPKPQPARGPGAPVPRLHVPHELVGDLAGLRGPLHELLHDDVAGPEHYPRETSDPERLYKQRSNWGQGVSHLCLYFLKEMVSGSGSLSQCSGPRLRGRRPQGAGRQGAGGPAAAHVHQDMLLLIRTTAATTTTTTTTTTTNNNNTTTNNTTTNNTNNNDNNNHNRNSNHNNNNNNDTNNDNHNHNIKNDDDMNNIRTQETDVQKREWIDDFPNFGAFFEDIIIIVNVIVIISCY